MSVSSLRIVFFALQLADLFTTLLVFQLGGYEANPLVARMLPRLGLLAGLVAAKHLAVLIMFGLRSQTLIRCQQYRLFRNRGLERLRDIVAVRQSIG
jgi:hypothetical protein